MNDCSLESVAQVFDPFGSLATKKIPLVMDQYAYSLVYGDPEGPKPEYFLPMIEPERKPSLLLFPSRRPPPPPEPKTSTMPRLSKLL